MGKIIRWCGEITWPTAQTNYSVPLIRTLFSGNISVGSRTYLDGYFQIFGSGNLIPSYREHMWKF
jgi:hypothetical protein